MTWIDRYLFGRAARRFQAVFIGAAIVYVLGVAAWAMWR